MKAGIIQQLGPPRRRRGGAALRPRVVPGQLGPNLTGSKPLTSDSLRSGERATMTAPKEMEVKLEVAPARVASLEKIPLVRALKARPRRTTEISVYFDTDKHKLRKKGLLLRVRRIGNRYIQTIKANGKAGLLERSEWETEISGEEPDLSLAEGTALAPLVNGKLRRRLRPQFETRVQRTTYPLADDRRAIALTIDRGKIDTGTRSAPLCEIELELKRGNATELFDVARELSAAPASGRSSTTRRRCSRAIPRACIRCGSACVDCGRRCRYSPTCCAIRRARHSRPSSNGWRES